MIKLLKEIKWRGIKKYFDCLDLNDQNLPFVKGEREMKGQNSQLKRGFEIIYDLCLLILYPLVNIRFKYFKSNTTVVLFVLLLPRIYSASILDI